MFSLLSKLECKDNHLYEILKQVIGIYPIKKQKNEISTFYNCITLIK